MQRSFTGDINAKLPHMQSLLQYATSLNKDNLIKLLLTQGAKTEKTGLLNYIVALGKIDLLKWILDNKVEINVSEQDCISKKTPLAASGYNFKITKLLLQAGAKIDHSLIKQIFVDNNSYLLRFIIQEKPSLTVAELDVVKAWLEVTKDSDQIEIIELLKNYVEQNDTWSNFFIKTFFPETQIDSSNKCELTENHSQDHVMKAINVLTSYFFEAGGQSVYSAKHMDAELIVTLPVIISEGLYQGEVVEIMQPLYDYWQENISPAIDRYQIKEDISDVCLPLVANIFSIFIE